ncbi:NADPH:quinone oxidoreductase family protein [Ferrovibrio sp.]|uniref:NADPH:quinone oxidoreductase family protein n=1 Tax=Ferrovibrio sp. TaxID=1917215 RepID=UPI0025BBB6F2|nr:NADPH:quinone oxidoreductase family protein [Ferrovibrio sp.]MBX3453655.1 NADPH:quinone oxidoreductase family protein [Ferrovibrio sp.]
MRAVLVRDFGPLDAAKVEIVPDPAPGPGEVVVQVKAAPVNFVDTVVIAGKYQFKPPLPFIPGKGPAGIIAALGAGVTDLKIGDRVLAMAETGGYAERVAVSAGQCYRLPDAMDFNAAATVSLAFDTAWFGLRERGRVQPGETVLVLGATGAVGLAGVQLAKALGARVLAAVSAAAKGDVALALGADALIDLSQPDLRESLRQQVYAANNGKGADVVLDMLGGDMFDAALRAMAWRGRLVVIGFAAGRIPEVKANYLLVKNIEVSGLQISDYRKRMPDLVRQCFTEVFGFFEAGKIKAGPVDTFPLDRYGEALQGLVQRSLKGRAVLIP